MGWTEPHYGLECIVAALLFEWVMFLRFFDSTDMSLAHCDRNVYIDIIHLQWYTA